MLKDFSSKKPQNDQGVPIAGTADLDPLNPFKTRYNALNAEQKRAVDTIEGPVMVIAGPGTGKTSILTLRIANILLKTDIEPAQILALTFTESGVHAMRSKLLAIIGPSAYKVRIFTFHGFCNDIIQRFPEKFPHIIGATAATDIDQISIIEKCLLEGVPGFVFDKIRPTGDPLYYVKKILPQIKDLKRDGISPNDLRKSLVEDEKAIMSEPDLYHEKGAHKGKVKSEYKKRLEQVEKNKELAQVYECYESALREKRLYDFDDMILEVIKVMHKLPDFLLLLQEESQYILADEHQDANNSQNTILELLSGFHASPNLFIVGDEKQAIYRFQGASLENFFYFKKRYPDAVVISLSKNYRSVQKILDASHALIQNNPLPDGMERVRLEANTVVNESVEGELVENVPVQIHSFDTDVDEMVWIAKKTKSLIESGVLPENIAVIYRKNKDVKPLARAFSAFAVPYKIESSDDIFATPLIRKLISLLSAVAVPNVNSSFGDVLFVDWLNISALDAYKIYTYAKAEKVLLFDVIKSPKHLEDAGILDKESIDSIVTLSDKILRWAQESHHEHALSTLMKIIKESGLVDSVLKSSDSVNLMKTLDAFIVQIASSLAGKSDSRLNNILDYIRLRDEHEIKSKGISIGNHQSVHFMTAHSSKGLEFDYVFVCGLTENSWGESEKAKTFKIPLLHGVALQKSALKSKNDSGDASQDEGQSSGEDSHALAESRRLFYVAITRAKKQVFISYPTHLTDGTLRMPSRFISEIESHAHITVNPKGDIAENAIATYIDISQTDNKASIMELAYIQKTFLQRGISPTALSNYEECCWKYFFNNLILVPDVKSPQQEYGTAMHNTLQVFFNKYKENNGYVGIGQNKEEHFLSDETMNSTQAFELFAHNLRKTSLSSGDLGAYLEKGKHCLIGYIDSHIDPKTGKGNWNANLITEYSPKGAHLPIDLNEVKIALEKTETEGYVLDEKLLVPLTGRIDKIEFIDDMHVNTVDYKTGEPKSRNAIEGKTKDKKDTKLKDQLVFYKYLLSKEENQKFIMDTGQLVFLTPRDSGTFASEKFEITDEELPLLEQRIIKMAKDVLSFGFKDKKCNDSDCKYCAMAERVFEAKS